MVSRTGMFGVQQFDAILPPGTGSILAIAASTPKVNPMITNTLSNDEPYLNKALPNFDPT